MGVLCVWESRPILCSLSLGSDASLSDPWIPTADHLHVTALALRPEFLCKASYLGPCLNTSPKRFFFLFQSAFRCTAFKCFRPNRNDSRVERTWIFRQKILFSIMVLGTKLTFSNYPFPFSARYMCLPIWTYKK